MIIDYVCFVVPKFGEPVANLELARNENDVWVFTEDNRLYESAKKNNILLIYDAEKDYFLNAKGNKVDINGKTVFAHCWISQTENLFMRLQQEGANLIEDLECIKKVDCWPNYFNPKHRKAFVTNFTDLCANEEKFKKELKVKENGRFFIKSVLKGWSKVVSNFGTLEIEMPNSSGELEKLAFPYVSELEYIDLSQKIIVSEYVGRINDAENNIPCKEYRAFVIDGKIISFSRSYVDWETQIPEDVKDFAKDFVEEVNNVVDFPKCYVADFGEVMDGNARKIDLIECNAISHSGIEVCNRNLIDNIVKMNAYEKGLASEESEN